VFPLREQEGKEEQLELGVEAVLERGAQVELVEQAVHPRQEQEA